MSHDARVNSAPAQQILVVEDDAALRHLLALYLRELGHVVHEAEDGSAALRLLQTLTPDLVCLDLRLPKRSGFEVCQEMRKATRLENVPVLVLSALTAPEHRTAAEEAGADDYLTKPVRRAPFAAAVEQLLGCSALPAT